MREVIMCVPGCQEHVFAKLSRRGFFRGMGVAAAGATLPAMPSLAQTGPRASRVIDLTHTLSPAFPTFFGVPGITMKRKFDFKKDGFNLFEWELNEHSGTHIDAPIHFAAEGQGPAEIDPRALVLPLAVIDVSAKAAANADYQMTVADIEAWEAANGKLPDGCCVAMNSGWDKHVTTPKYVGKDAAGFHFPGVAFETAEFLVRQRSVWGLAVDTLSLDHGPSKDFKTHYLWLPSGRWGLENVANLGNVPAKGATIVVGAPKVKDATGGPTRIFALV
jgi:kynurenine formamidase